MLMVEIIGDADGDDEVREEMKRMVEIKNK